MCGNKLNLTCAPTLSNLTQQTHKLFLLQGAMAKLTVDDAQFTKTSLELLLTSFSKQYNAATHIYRTSNETVHITISDNNTNELSLKMARLLDSYFKSNNIH